MDPRGAHARVRFANFMFLSTSECTLPRFSYQKRYTSLLNALRKSYASPAENDGDPLDAFPGARAVLKEREEDGVSSSPEDAVIHVRN